MKKLSLRIVREHAIDQAQPGMCRSSILNNVCLIPETVMRMLPVFVSENMVSIHLFKSTIQITMTEHKKNETLDKINF